MSKRDDLLKLAKMADSKGDTETAKKALLMIKEIDSKPTVAQEMLTPLAATYMAAKNIPESAQKYGSNIVSGVKQIVTNPVESAKGLYDFGNSLMNKGEQSLVNAMPDQIVNYMNRSNNWLADKGVPLKRLPENKQDMTFDNLGPANKAAGLLSERYGSLDKLKNTAINDPVGSLADAALVTTGVGGLLGGARGAQIGAAIDPINLTKNLVKKTGGLIPEATPTNMYKSAVKFSTTLDEADKTKMARTALDEGIMPTGKGIEKAKEITNGINNMVNSLIDSSVKKGELIPVKAVYTKLKDLRQKVGGAKLEAKADLKKIDDAAREFGSWMKERGQTHMTVKEMQDFKINLTKKIYGDKLALRSIPEKDNIRKAMSDSAREAIANKIPEIADLNKRESGLLNLVKGLDRPAGRIDNLNYFGLDPTVKGGAGYMAANAVGVSPEIGGAVGIGAGLLGKPLNKVRMAMVLDKIRKAGKQKGLLTSDPLIRSILQQTAYQSGSKGLLE